MTSDRRFGELPLQQTRDAAAAMRRLTGLLQSLEHAHPLVDEMLASFAGWEAELAASAPADTAVRLTGDGPGRRRSLQHAFDPGAYNPCFPEYRFEHMDPEKASGTVTFDLPYEGPGGLVHCGFLSLFFDTVTQHHNCAAALAGKTRSLLVTYRRPTPLLTELRFAIERLQVERRITSTARLLLDDEVLCTGEVSTVALPPDVLPGAKYDLRRDVDGPGSGR